MSITGSSGKITSSVVDVCSITSLSSATTLDIRSILRRICIFNSLDSMLTSGYIEVLDQGNAIAEYSLNGKEIIDISIKLRNNNATESIQPSDEFNVYTRRFFVYAIDSIGVIKDQMSYKIRFIDPFAMLNTDNRISWHFKQTKGEDIIKKIQTLVDNQINGIYKTAMRRQVSNMRLSSSQDLFDFRSEITTKHELDLYVPMMKPFELIRWLADRVVSNDSPCKWSDCLFYQTKDGRFHLNSFKNLYSQKPLVFTQQIASSATEEKHHLIESYTFNKIYNTQVDKLNGIYGLQFAIADFKPTTNVVTQSTVLGTTISSSDALAGSSDKSLSLHNSIKQYFRGVQLGVDINTDNANGYIQPFQCSAQEISSAQVSPNGKGGVAKYNTATGALIFLDACGIIHEDDKTYNEYERVAFPYVTGCIMKKVLSTYVINLTMNGAFDIDVGKSFTVKLDSTDKTATRQMACFISGVVWLCSDVQHEWNSEENQVKTYVTGFTPFIRQGTRIGSVKQ